MNEVATPPQHKVENIATSNYFVTHHRADPRRVIVSFASRGFNAAGEPIEEFARTLAAFGVSAIFVTDRSGQWWNHPETFRIFPEIARLCSRYEHIGLIGESMGASGAIAFSRFLPEAARILGFSPQYSVASPFIEFDKRYRNAKDEIGFFNFAAYNDADARRKAQLLFGNVEWEDHIHASMFLSEGFKAGFIDGAPHDVAGHLKTAYKRNVLSTLLDRFCDFARPFDDDATASAVGDLYGPPLKTAGSFAPFSSTIGRQRHLRTRLAPPAGLSNIALGCAAQQSSVYQYSGKPTIAEDAAGAVNGVLTGRYSFHTGEDDPAWWSVDLGRDCDVFEVRIYNRTDDDSVARRFRRFAISCAPDGGDWQIVRRFESAEAPTIPGVPFVWSTGAPATARYIRISLLGRGCLHLDEVEVYGR